MKTLYESEIMQIWIDAADDGIFVNMVDRGITLQYRTEDPFHDFVDALNKARDALDTHYKR